MLRKGPLIDCEPDVCVCEGWTYFIHPSNGLEYSTLLYSDIHA